MSNIEQLEFNEASEVLDGVGKSAKALIQAVYFGKGQTSVKEIKEQLDLTDLSDIDFLSEIGKVNGKIYAKYGVALYPTTPARTIAESKFTLGKVMK